MQSILIEGTHKLPSVHFDYVSGKLEIKGKSAPEDSLKFYKPLLDWIAEYKAQPQLRTEVNLNLEYFNTATSKCLTDVLKAIDAIYKAGNNITLNWFYVDEFILEAGEDYQSFLNIPFKMIPVEE